MSLPGILQTGLQTKLIHLTLRVYQAPSRMPSGAVFPPIVLLAWVSFLTHGARVGGLTP